MSEPSLTAPFNGTVPLDEPLLSAEQVAELLHIPRASVYEYCRRAHDPLPCIRVGRHRRFHRPDLERWLSAQRG